MKAFIISTLSALTLAGALNVADIGVAAAQAGACFRGDTMDRDGGPTGALGAAKCGTNHTQPTAFRANRTGG
jgi:hypothetical protein